MAEAAAKEPSMEDILASIRKIIAQDDPRPKPSETPPVRLETLNGAAQPPERQQAMPPAQSPAQPSSATGQPSYRTQVAPRPNSATTLAALASQVRQEMPRGPAATGQAATPQATSPAAVQTMVQSTPATSATMAAASQPAAPAAVQQQAAAAKPVENTPPRATNESGAMSLAALAASVSSANPAPRPAAGPSGTVAAQAASVGPRPGPAPVDAAPAAAAPMQPGVAAAGSPAVQAPAKGAEVARPAPAQPEKTLAQAAEVSAFRDALVSPSTSQMVQGSLDRLKAAMADDTSAKVETVLRPMLREWLDANLPSMVERIVREEIERIARG